MTPGELRRLYFIIHTFLSYGLDELIPKMRITLPLRIWRRMLFWMPNRHQDQPLGARLRLALQELGPVWIKFGQMLSTRRDLFPPHIADQLALLQDRVAPFEGKLAQQQIEKAMGGLPVEAWFDDFSVEPLASASIAQVHTARLKENGKEVVIKVIRPDILPIIKADMKLIYRLARWVPRLLPDGRRLRPQEVVHFFDQSWFKQLMRYALDSIYWGHSLIELGDLCTDGDGCICYSDVKLIPRKHVIPEYGRVITDLGQDWTTGIDYRQPPFSDWLIEAGRPDDLGLYLKAASQTIPKKNMLAFWDTFGEIFGMPMRIARTTSRDQKEIDRLDKMLREAGTALSMVAGMETEIEFVESGKGDAFNVYDKRIDRANSELSKLIIGQTMTIEDGSSLSQSETHLEVFQNLVESDCDMLRDIVNNQLIPRMVRHGFPVKGLRFDWDYSIDYTPEQQKAYEEMVLQHYKVKPQYFEEKYGIPCEEKEPKEEPDPTEPKKKKDGKPAETLSRFFD